MISGKQSNFAFLSKLIKEKDQYATFWKDLKNIFDKEKILHGFLEHTEDLWVKEYMPIQSKIGQFVQFAFFPEQANTNDAEIAKTNPLKVTNNMDLGEIIQSELTIDGRDIIINDKKIVVTDKIFTDNSFIKDRSKIIDRFKELLNLNKVIVLPKFKKGHSWHIDCFVRFLNDNTLLVSDLSKIKRSWVKDFEKSLHETGELLTNFPSAMSVDTVKNDALTSFGCYINFVQIGDKIIFPQYGIKEDEEALKEIKKMYPYCKILPIDCTNLVNECAGLSTVIWNIKV